MPYKAFNLSQNGRPNIRYCVVVTDNLNNNAKRISCSLSLRLVPATILRKCTPIQHSTRQYFVWNSFTHKCLNQKYRILYDHLSDYSTLLGTNIISWLIHNKSYCHQTYLQCLHLLPTAYKNLWFGKKSWIFICEFTFQNIFFLFTLYNISISMFAKITNQHMPQWIFLGHLKQTDLYKRTYSYST